MRGESGDRAGRPYTSCRRVEIWLLDFRFPDRRRASHLPDRQPGFAPGVSRARLAARRVGSNGLELDHLAVSANTLEEAAQAVESALGVAMRPGGRHDVFATHNRLLGLADGLYLEAIAIDPDAPAPKRPRWFDLDRFSGPARLTNWICRVDDLSAALSGLEEGAGAPVALRRGDLRWSMAVPKDGRLPFDNLFTALIQWQGTLHPAAMLPPSGCALRRLVVAHPRAGALRKALAGLADARVVFETGAPALMAEFDTPHGARVL